jgi:hypothetical protein
MSENLYQVKAFVMKDGKYQEIVENFSTYDEGEKRYNDLVHQNQLPCDAAYLYMDGTLSQAWSQSYDDYLDEQADKHSCVICGAHSDGGYCWQSPDGQHHFND